MTRLPFSRRFVAFLFLGIALRVVALPLPGTGDVGVWKAWAYYAAHHGAKTIYGVGSDAPRPNLVRWKEKDWIVEYPPLAMYVFEGAGRLYRSLDRRMPDGPAFSVAVKLPSLLAEAALVVLIFALARRALDRPAAEGIALAYWLNPACLLNASALGYVDPMMALPVVGAVAAAASVPNSRAGGLLAGALLAVGALTKAQGVLVGPAVLIALLNGSGGPAGAARRVVQCAIAGLAVTALAVLPIATVGALPNLLGSLAYLGAHDMLSGNACNLWWIVTWLMRAAYSLDMGVWNAFTAPTRILNISRVVELGYPNPRLIGLGLMLGTWAWALWRARRARDPWLVSGLAAFLVHAYFVLSAQVHENHLFPAIPLALVAGIGRPRWRKPFAALSVIQALNFAFFYGVSEDIALPALPRTFTIVDTTVWLALANCVALAWHARVLSREAGSEPTTASAPRPAST